MVWLPEQAVGRGATWRQTYTQVDDDGRRVAHTVSVRLSGLDGDRIQLERTWSSSGGVQPEQAGLAVTSATARATSTITTRLHQLSWIWSYRSTARYQAVKDGSPVEVETTIASRCRATPETSR